jgi:HlyD family secretion protein
MKRNTWIALAGAGVVATGLLAWAFAPRAVEVEAVAATRGPFETAVEEDGRTRVSERHAVTAPIAGRLRRIALREGDAVQAGQALALIEPLPSPLLDERSRGEQQARAAAAQAALERAGTRVRAAQVGVEQALNEQRRTAQLVAQGFVSPAKADTDRLALDAATREREGAVESERVARFELQQTRVALELSSGPAPPGRTFTVRAPVAGMVLRVHQASEGVVGIGTPLLDLADTSRIEIVAELLTGDAAVARPGSPVRIERWGGPGSLQGQVRRVEPAAFTKVSALGVEEQRVNVLIDLVPASAASSGGAVRADVAPAALLGDGWRVVVRILTRQEADVLRVPVSAVFPWPGPAQRAAAPPSQAASGAADSVAGQGTADAMGVFVVEGGRARLRTVQVVARNGSLAWVRSGLVPGEVVIAYPPPTVADGVRVKPRQG